MHERDAFRAIFSFGGALSDLNTAAVGGVPAALNNARQFVVEAVAMLAKQQRPRTQIAEVA
jgi:chromosome partitioning protein